MSSNRPAEIEIINLRMSQAEAAMTAIHTAFHTAFENTANITKDTRGYARLQVYQLISQSLNIDVLVALNPDQFNTHDIDAFFKQHTKVLDSFYNSAEESNSLTTEDKNFFDFIVNVFRALTTAHFHYRILATHIEKLTPNVSTGTLDYIKDLSLKITHLFSAMDSLHIRDTELATRSNHLKKIEQNLQNTLHGIDISPNEISYSEKYEGIAAHYNTLAKHLNELHRESINLQKERSRIKDTLRTGDNSEIKHNIEKHNQCIIAFSEKIQRYRDAQARLKTHAHTLYADIHGQVTTYNLAAKTLAATINQRNAYLQSLHEQIQQINHRLNYLSADTEQAFSLLNAATTPVDTFFMADHSSPKAFCNTLKINNWFSSKHNTEWTTLGNTITEQLRQVNQPVHLPYAESIIQSKTNAIEQNNKAKSALDRYQVIKPAIVMTKHALSLIENNNKALERQNNDTSARLNAIKTPQPITFRRYLLRSSQELEAATDDATKSHSKKGFFQRHWKAMLGGFLLGTTIGIIAALTIGVLPAVLSLVSAIVIGATAATKVGIATGISGLLMGAAGVMTAGSVNAAHDYIHSRYRIAIDDEPSGDIEMKSKEELEPGPAPTKPELVFIRSGDPRYKRPPSLQMPSAFFQNSPIPEASASPTTGHRRLSR